MAIRDEDRALLRELELDDSSEGVERVEWSAFFSYLADNWSAGEHASIFAPTGKGKTSLMRAIWPLWQKHPALYLAIDDGDPVLRGMGHPVESFPSSVRRLKYQHRKLDSPDWVKDPEWFVLRIPGYRWSAEGRRNQNITRARELAGGAIDQAFAERGWLLGIDEVRAFSDSRPPSLDLEPVLENAWQRGRKRGLTIVAATQAPVYAPGSMYDQATHIFFGKTKYLARAEKLGEIGGNVQLVREIVPTLNKYEWLYVPNGIDAPMQIVTAPPPR